MSDLDALRYELQRFAEERDWEQYHTPKNLTLALAAEVGELAALFQWLQPEESVIRARADLTFHAATSDELADILIYLLRLADVLDVDILAAARAKIAANRERWPAGKLPAPEPKTGR